LHKSPANRHMLLPAMARFRFLAGTRRVHFGTSGHSRARATSRDTAWKMLETLERDTHPKNPCKQGSGVDRSGAMTTPSFASEGVVGRAIPVAAHGTTAAQGDEAQREAFKSGLASKRGRYRCEPFARVARRWLRDGGHSCIQSDAVAAACRPPTPFGRAAEQSGRPRRPLRRRVLRGVPGLGHPARMSAPTVISVRSTPS
jgi:hypothetical protein